MILTNLEVQVLEAMLAGDHPFLALLRQQVEQVDVTSREMTGVGFSCDFAVPEVLRIPGKPSFQVTDVVGVASNVTEGLGFVLFVTDGVLSMLEGYTYDEPWPKDIKNLHLTYTKGINRDFTKFPKPSPAN